MIIYVAIFIVISLFALEYEIGKAKMIWPFYIITVFLALFAGLRAQDIGRDYAVYQYAFDNLGNTSPGLENFWKVYEPGFVAIVYVFKLIFTSSYTLSLMLFFAFVGVSLKAKAILNVSLNPYVALLVYYSTYFFLHDMTQIRIGIAAGIFLLTLPYFIKGKHIQFIVAIGIACLFHYSSVLFLGVYFFRRHRFSKLWFLFLLLTCIPLAFIKLPLDNLVISFSTMQQASSKITSYSHLVEMSAGEPITMFNFMSVSKFAVCMYLLYMVPQKELETNAYLSLFIKLGILSVFILYLTAGIPLFSFRLSDLFGIVIIFLYPYLLRYLPFKSFNIWFIILLSAIYFYLNIFHSELLKPYRIYHL